MTTVRDSGDTARWGLRIGAAVAMAIGTTLALIACSAAPKLVPQGGECAVTTDCDRGLVCVPQKAGGRTCTSDLSSIDNPPATTPDAQVADGGRDGSRDGQGDGPPQGDGQSPPDTGPPPADTGPPPADTGTD